MIRQFILFSLATIFALQANLVSAQPFPARTVKIIVSTAPGGAPDVIARLIAEKLSTLWDRQVVVENRPGAAGNISAQVVARSAPDGYTLLFYDSPIWAINPHIFAKLPYDPFKDLAPVVQTHRLPLFLVVPSSVPANYAAQLVAYAKQNPGKLAYSSAGSGSSHHLTAELFRSMADINIVHVPYKGGAPSAIALSAGEVQMGFLSYPLAQAGVSSGKLRMLGIGSGQRSAALPDIPTISESGVPGFDLYTTLGMLAPAGTPHDVIAKIHAGVINAIGDAEVRRRIASFGITVAPQISPDQFGVVMQAEFEKFGRLVKLSGARLE